MPTRRQVLHGMGMLAAGGLVVNVPLMADSDLLTGKSAHFTRRAAATRPACGADRAGGLWPAISTATGGLAGYRGYDSPAQGVPSSWPGPGAGPVPEAASLPVISIRPDIDQVLSGSLDQALKAFASLVPAGAMVTCWHEGEAARNNFTTGQVLGLHARCYPIFKAAAPSCRYGQIIGSYTATRASGHYPLGRWMAPGLDFYGLDGYQATRSHTAASVFGAAAEQIRGALGTVQLTVTECNSAIQSSRPSWFNETWSWAQANNCLTYFTYWDAVGSGTAYEWLPGDSATISALAAINAASKVS